MPEDTGAQADSPQPDALAAPSAVSEGVSDQQPSGTAPPPPSQAEAKKPWNLPPEERWGNEIWSVVNQYSRAREDRAMMLEVLADKRANDPGL